MTQTNPNDRIYWNPSENVEMVKVQRSHELERGSSDYLYTVLVRKNDGTSWNMHAAVTKVWAEDDSVDMFKQIRDVALGCVEWTLVADEGE